MYDSGAMSYDGETPDFSNFENMGGFSNMGGYSNMGQPGQGFKFSFNGKDMGGGMGQGMGGIDPS